MPSPQQIEFAAELAEGLGKQLVSGSSEGGLNLLRIALPEAAVLAKGGEAAERIIAASQQMEGGLSRLATSLQPESLLMDARYARVTAPGLVPGPMGPRFTTIPFDSGSRLASTWSFGKVPSAFVARVPLDPLEPVSYGSAFVSRADGAVIGASHTMRATRGDIWVKLAQHPVAFKAGMVAEETAEDLAMLKPLSPLGRPMLHLQVTDFADVSRGWWKGTDLVTVGGQNQVFTRPGMLTGDATMAQGKFMDFVPTHFQGGPTVQRIRSTIPGEWGMSGAATYDVNSGKFVGTMLGGADGQWTGLASSNKVLQFIQRNIRR